MKTKPALGIKDPYELNKTQFDATVDLLKQQRPLRQEVLDVRLPTTSQLFKTAMRGSARPGRTAGALLGRRRCRSKDIIPKEGATGWLDTWMLSSKSKNPNCAYMW